MISLSLVCSCRSAPTRLAVVPDVTPEGPRGGELPQLVADHRVGHEHRHVLAAVVHRNRVADHVRDDGGPAGPGPDDGLAARLVEGVHLLEQVVVHERALLQAARHVCTSPAQRFLPVRRRRTIILSAGLVRRVRPSGLPAGFTGCRPPEVLPSPPPCGWSTGFMATPRTVGRLPFHRMRPALPQLMFDCSALPTSPTVARQRTSTLRISPDGMRSCASRPSRATSWTLVPAERAIFAPPPGRSSMAWTTVPTGMFRSGRLLPGLMSAEGPHSTVSPCFRRAGAMMYRFSPSAKCSSAMRDVRLGSYSMCATLAGTPSLSARRKSIRRYARLWPPPWWRAVTFPCTLRPPLECNGRTSDFSGVSRVISAKSETLDPRRPGVVGLYLRMPMSLRSSALVSQRSGR